MIGNYNPINLKGLKQALYVLQSLENGKTANQIVDAFDGDQQLVEIWTNFVIDNHWIEATESGGFSVTEKGKGWLDRMGTTA